MIKQVGSQWCLFTADGSRRLGCHDTKEEAVAQEAAIKAGQFAEEHAGEIPIDDGNVRVLDNGDVIKWMPLALSGKQWINGPHEFDITKDLVEQAIKNFEAGGKQPIPITLGHVDDSAAAAVGWIEDLDIRNGAPWGKVRWLAKTWERITAGEYKFFSLEFFTNGLDRNGKDVGFLIDGGALLNKPFFPIRVDQQAQHGASPCYRLSRFSAAGGQRSKEGQTVAMSIKQVGEEYCIFDGEAKGRCYASEEAAKAAMAEMAGGGPSAGAGRDPVISGDRVTLSRSQFDLLMKAQRECESLRGELETMRGEKESVEARLGRLERSRTADRIRSAVKELQQRGIIVQLGDHNLKNDTDAFEWLAGAPWGVTSVEGLQKLADDEANTAHLPRIKLGGEKSGGINTLPPADLTTEAGRKEAVRRRVAQLRRENSKEELDTMLRSRRQDLEAFAYEDLAAEHPEHRQQFTADLKARSATA